MYILDKYQVLREGSNDRPYTGIWGVCCSGYELLLDCIKKTVAACLCIVFGFPPKKGTAGRAANDRPYGYQKRHFESLATVGIYRKYLV